jgi:hypothetical protein
MRTENKSIVRTIVWLTVFSVAMGYLETSVVVYLRKMLYPGSFPFPLSPVKNDIAVVEFWREIATILMLIGAGVIAGRNKLERFGLFLYCFAVWDIFYYVFLKVLIGWPGSLADWDILFLVPVPWVGPVIAPCIVSLTMIAFALIIVRLNEAGYKVSVTWKEWLLMITGCCVILASFMWDYISYVMMQGGSHGLWTLASSDNLFREAESFIPARYRWEVFAAGELLICSGIVRMAQRIRGSLKLQTIKS